MRLVTVKKEFENMVAIEFSSHITKQLTHQNVRKKMLKRVREFDCYSLNGKFEICAGTLCQP